MSILRKICNRYKAKSMFSKIGRELSQVIKRQGSGDIYLIEGMRYVRWNMYVSLRWERSAPGGEGFHRDSSYLIAIPTSVLSFCSHRWIYDDPVTLTRELGNIQKMRSMYEIKYIDKSYESLQIMSKLDKNQEQLPGHDLLRAVEDYVEDKQV